MIKKNFKLIFIVVILTVLTTGGVLAYQKVLLNREIKEIEKKQNEAVKIVEPVGNTLKENSKIPEISNPNKPKIEEKPKEASLPSAEIAIPSSYNIAVPFTSQAPFAKWDERDEDACEEAALLMAAQYFKKINLKIENSKINSNQVDQELNKIIDWENKNIGEWKSTTIEQTARVAREYFGLKTEVKNLSFDEIKKALVQKKLVILPAAGRRLNNPYFKTPKPLYHMFLVKGWNQTDIITNDPGTKRGADFVYTQSNLESAVHDWPVPSEVEGNGGEVENGAQQMLVVDL